MKNLILIIYLAFACLSLKTEQKKTYSSPRANVYTTDSIAISYINLNPNSLLYREIKKYIKDRTDNSTLFKSGFGFIIVERVKLFSHAPALVQDLDKYAKDVLTIFNLSTASYPLSDTYSLTRFPTYYTIVDSRLVLFYDELLEWFTRPSYNHKSKAKVEQLVLNSLQKALQEDFIFYNPLQQKTFTLNKEQRKTMSEREILELASLTIAHSRTVTEYYDRSVIYTP